mmetsp:Transcript_19062/g.44099  ORF Transcript_19062/g.44099 Transcript_19062/m.44099 type:complete len:363 (-) Transcript_19062:6-1094(-)
MANPAPIPRAQIVVLDLNDIAGVRAVASEVPLQAPLETPEGDLLGLDPHRSDFSQKCPGGHHQNASATGPYIGVVESTTMVIGAGAAAGATIVIVRWDGRYFVSAATKHSLSLVVIMIIVIIIIIIVIVVAIAIAIVTTNPTDQWIVSVQLQSVPPFSHFFRRHPRTNKVVYGQFVAIGDLVDPPIAAPEGSDHLPGFGSQMLQQAVTVTVSVPSPNRPWTGKSLRKDAPQDVIGGVPPQVEYFSRFRRQNLGALGSLADALPVANLAGRTVVAPRRFLKLEPRPLALPAAFRGRCGDRRRRCQRHGVGVGVGDGIGVGRIVLLLFIAVRFGPFSSLAWIHRCSLSSVWWLVFDAEHRAGLG